MFPDDYLDYLFMPTRTDILGIGQSVVGLSVQVPQNLLDEVKLPCGGEFALVTPSEQRAFIRRLSSFGLRPGEDVGGSVVNSVLAAGSLKGESMLISRVGSDDRAARFVSAVREHGVQFKPITVEGATAACLVAVARNRYSVPCELAGQTVSTRLYPGKIVVVAGDDIVASHERLSDRGQTRYNWQHYIPLIQRKPGALRNGAPFADMPEPLQQLRRALLRDPGGDRVMAQVLAAVPTAGLDAVLVAVELVLEAGAVSAEHVLNVLARLNATPPPQNVETALTVNEVPTSDTGRYDSLRGPEQTTGQEVGHA